jgi:hypothetical protein
MIFFNNKLLIFFFNQALYFVNCFGLNKLSLFFIKRFLVLSLKSNLININIFKLYNFDLFYDFVINKHYLSKKMKDITKNFDNLHTKKISLQGIGFKSWLFSTKQKYNFLVLKIGFSFDICYFIMSGVRCICLKSTLVLFKSVNKQILFNLVNSISFVKKWNLYKNNGIFLFDKTYRSKFFKNK